MVVEFEPTSRYYNFNRLRCPVYEIATKRERLITDPRPLVKGEMKEERMDFCWDVENFIAFWRTVIVKYPFWSVFVAYLCGLFCLWYAIIPIKQRRG